MVDEDVLERLVEEPLAAGWSSGAFGIDRVGSTLAVDAG